MLKFLGLGEESTGVAAEKYGKNVDDLFYRLAVSILLTSPAFNSPLGP